MRDEAGNPDFPVWLVGDSEPEAWATLLATPLDPRHPARHNIWTPVLEYLQDFLYRSRRVRFDSSNIYIRNAIRDSNVKPTNSATDWPQKVQAEVDMLRENLTLRQPIIILSFGAFAFEFLRRALDEKPKLSYRHWGTRALGEEFRKRTTSFDPGHVNVLPLLHVSIARGRFIQSHNYFTQEQEGNYFEYVGTRLARLLTDKMLNLPIWVKGQLSES